MVNIIFGSIVDNYKGSPIIGMLIPVIGKSWIGIGESWLSFRSH